MKFRVAVIVFPLKKYFYIKNFRITHYISRSGFRYTSSKFKKYIKEISNKITESFIVEEIIFKGSECELTHPVLQKVCGFFHNFL